MNARILPVLVGLTSVLAAGAVSVCERSEIEFRPDGLRCTPRGEVVFSDSFADAAAWPVRMNFEKRLKLDFGQMGKEGPCLKVSGLVPPCDTAWNLRTAFRPLPHRASRFRFSFRLATRMPIRVAGWDTEGWWTSLRWIDASGTQTNVHRVSWAVSASPYGMVVEEGEIPSNTVSYAVQIGFDGPNISAGNDVTFRDVKLELLDANTGYAPQGWFCSNAHASGPISWTADVPDGCRVKFQCAQGDTVEALAQAPFLGPDGTANTFWEKPFTPAKPWCRYKAVLISDGGATPVLKTVAVGETIDLNWTADADGLPPRVKVVSATPTTDAKTPLRLSVTDESLVLWKSLKVAVDGVERTSAFSRQGSLLTLENDAPWTNGLHTVDVAVSDWYGNTSAAHKFFFIGETPKTSRISLREDGMTLIDGLPFFPVGIYGVMRREFNAYNFDRAFADLKQGGFNFAHSYASPHEDAFLDAAWKQGIRVWNVARFPDRRFIDVERHHPAIIAWYLGDDTSAHETPEQLMDYDDAVKAVDPTRITTQADGVGASSKISNYGPYVEGTDNFLAEIYPVHADTEAMRRDCVAKVICDMERVRADVRASGTKQPRSVWPIIQYFKGWGWERFPHRDELEAMSFAALIHGAHGITWYTYGGTVEPERKKFNYGITTSFERWNNMTNLATRISSLIPALVARPCEQPPQPVVVQGPRQDALGNASVSCLLKKTEDGLWLLTVNSTPEKVVARLKIPGCKGAGEVLWENRRVNCPVDGFDETFKPFAVHVYRFAQ